MEEDSSCPRGHMADHPQNDWGMVRYDPRFDVYWTPAGGAKQQLFFCPWCGERLPPSQRDRWFDELEALGIDPNIDPIPSEYQSGAWRGAIDKAGTPRQGGAIEGRYIDFFDIPPDEDEEPMPD
ncbi:DUF6980 family protein [Brevundimonas mediterranea]|jgi:hypothetical protein|uniref:DUF6980 family protein n=2 Tax=Brevundimonas TaxID=41275 RepID=UPI0012B6831A|nr:hypothetical protein [Brevundimonas mediterranea]